jgi:hypothetical protein
MTMNMLRSVWTMIAAGTVAASLVSGCGHGGPADGRLQVDGRSSATPWVTADGAFVAVAWGATTPDSKTDVFVATSRDGGVTFGAPVQVNDRPGEARLSGELPPRVALLRTAAADPELAVLWTARGPSTAIKLSRSHDGGRSFTSAVELQSTGAPGDRGWPSLALDASGVAHAVWLDHRAMKPKTEGSGHAAHQHGSPSANSSSPPSGLYYASSSATASTPERELANGVCYCCKTALAAGPDGALFAAWRHVYAGSLRDMAFTMSSDGGKTFAPPVRVSEDGWAIEGCPDDGPALAIDGRRVVHVVWPTLIDGPAPQGALFYASSQDGVAFTPRLRIPTLGSLKPGHVQIVAGTAGPLAVAWDELHEGRRKAAVSLLRPAAGGDMFAPPTLLGEGESAMYPVLASTANGLIAVWTAGSGDSTAIGFRVLPVGRQ